jgi:DHA2 family multidrug resistance protein
MAVAVEKSRYHGAYKWIAMIVTMIGFIMTELDESIVNVAVPKMMADFGVTLSSIEWVTTVYMLANAIFMPMTGWFREKTGYKNMYVASLVMFTFGSVLCGVAWNFPMLIIARVIQAISSGIIMPTVMAMITEIFEPEERGTAFSFMAIVFIFPLFGPILGGYLTDYFGWRSIFFINLPIGIIGSVAAFELLLNDKPAKAEQKPFDFWGFGFLSVFLICALLGISKGQSEGWTSAYIITCMTLASLGLTGFILVETSIKDPLMDLKLYKIPLFANMSILTVVRSAGMFGSIFLIPVFVQQQLGYTAVQSGMLMFPASVVMIAVMPLVGKLADKTGPKVPTLTGLAMVAISSYMYVNITASTSTWGLIYPMAIRNVGIALMVAPLMTAFMNVVPKDKIAVASSMNNILQQIGGAMGIAFFTAVMSNRSVFHIAIAGQNMKQGSEAMARSMELIMRHVHSLGYDMSTSLLTSGALCMNNIIHSAIIRSFQDTFFIAALAAAVSIPLAFLLPSKLVKAPGAGEVKDMG